MNRKDVELVLKVWLEKHKLFFQAIGITALTVATSAMIASLVITISAGLYAVLDISNSSHLDSFVSYLKMSMWFLCIWCVIYVLVDATCKTLLSRYSSQINEMFTKAKIHFLVWCHRKTFKTVELSLGFKLHSWQKEYIVGGSDDVVPCNRGNGKTTAHILRNILGFNISRKKRKKAICDYQIDTDAGKWNTPDTRYYRRHYMGEFISIYTKLKIFGVKLIPVKFEERCNKVVSGWPFFNWPYYTHTTTAEGYERRRKERGK